MGGGGGRRSGGEGSPGVVLNFGFAHGAHAQAALRLYYLACSSGLLVAARLLLACTSYAAQAYFVCSSGYALAPCQGLTRGPGLILSDGEG